MSEIDKLRESSELLPFSYCGLLDDKVAQFYRDYRSPDLFNQILAKSLFFGGGLLINDGYLFMNPLARQQMMDQDSLLFCMLDSGFVRIFTRCKTAAELVQLPESSKVPWHMGFAKSDDWDIFRATWDQICTTEWSKSHVQRWPPQRNHKVQAGFYLNVLDKEPVKLGLGLDKEVLTRLKEILFGDITPASPGLRPFKEAARTRYEEACRSALDQCALDSSDDSENLRSLMRIGNEAYHYSFGAILTYNYGRPFAVDTTISPAFDELIDRPNIDYRKFISMPSLGIPITADLSQGKKYDDLMIPGTDAYISKTQFLRKFLDATFVNESSEDEWKTTVEGLSVEYAKQLGATLGLPIDKFIYEQNTNQIVLAPSLTGGYDAAGSPLPGLSSAIVTADGERIGARLAQYTTRDEEKGLDWVFTGKEIIPQISSLALSKKFVEQILDDDFLCNDDEFRK